MYFCESKMDNIKIVPKKYKITKNFPLFFHRIFPQKIQNRSQNKQKISLQFYSQKIQYCPQKYKIIPKFSKSTSKSRLLVIWEKIVIFRNIFEFFEEKKMWENFRIFLGQK